MLKNENIKLLRWGPNNFTYLSLTERDKIVEFIQTSVLSNKHMFAKCYYMDIRSYEENTTNPVEQQNSSTKTGFASTKPNQSLESSAKKLTKKSRSVNADTTNMIHTSQK